MLLFDFQSFMKECYYYIAGSAILYKLSYVGFNLQGLYRKDDN